MTPYVGMIIAVGFTFAPPGWLVCDGSLQSIQLYETLFQLIGTTYGGDGNTSFALPDLRGRIPIHQGSLLGGGAYVLGQQGGAPSVALSANTLPSHNHLLASAGAATAPTPGGNLYANTSSPAYASGTANVQMGDSISITGSSTPHENRQPFLVLNWIIATEGVYPSPS